MRATNLVLALAILAAVSCGGSGSGPVLSMDADSGIHVEETVDVEHEICTPSCEGKECGSDGCSGDCGICKFELEMCTDEGLCIPTPCDSTKDCPGDLVCDKEQGNCVVCVGDEDCPEGLTCGADHECHAEFPCVSDLDCKDKKMVCDKAAGICVECLGPADCADGEYCEQGFCLPVSCTPGVSKCDGAQVLSCPDGSGWALSQTCTDLQYCDDGVCHNLACEPGTVWCEGDVYKVCAADGKTIEHEEDCAAKNQHCFSGACIDSVCVPNEKFCLDGTTMAMCLADGMNYSTLPCEVQQYCKDGGCLPWVCEPGQAACEGTVASTCNSLGSGYVSIVDCKPSNKVCADGQCQDLVCTPSSDFCADGDTLNHCAPDGMSFEPEECPAQHSCKGGTCHAWICVPGEPMCDDEVATACDELGLEPEPGGTNCAIQEKFCSAGECIETCQTQPDKAEFEYTGEIQQFVVPACVFSLTIKAVGGAGGRNIYCSQAGGKGAQMEGTFDVVPGGILSILVGEQGTDWGTSDCGYAGSGGGGTFVWHSQSGTLLLAAGGGGGGAVCKCAGSPENASGMDAPVGPCGSADKSGAYPGGCDGEDGMGEAAGLGWNSVLVDPSGVPGPINGGYGGGGADPNEHSGGGGGGYGGGGGRAYYDGSGSYGGGGGGSFNAGLAPSNVAGVGNGDGSVVIAYGEEIP